MNELVLHIEIVDTRFDAKVKGTKHEVIQMMVQAMQQMPEIAEAITEAAIAFHGVPRPGKIIYNR